MRNGFGRTPCSSRSDLVPASRPRSEPATPRPGASRHIRPPAAPAPGSAPRRCRNPFLASPAKLRQPAGRRPPSGGGATSGGRPSPQGHRKQVPAKPGRRPHAPALSWVAAVDSRSGRPSSTIIHAPWVTSQKPKLRRRSSPPATFRWPVPAKRRSNSSLSAAFEKNRRAAADPGNPRRAKLAGRTRLRAAPGPSTRRPRPTRPPRAPHTEVILPPPSAHGGRKSRGTRRADPLRLPRKILRDDRLPPPAATSPARGCVEILLYTSAPAVRGIGVARHHPEEAAPRRRRPPPAPCLAPVHGAAQASRCPLCHAEPVRTFSSTIRPARQVRQRPRRLEPGPCRADEDLQRRRAGARPEFLRAPARWHPPP